MIAYVAGCVSNSLHFPHLLPQKHPHMVGLILLLNIYFVALRYSTTSRPFVKQFADTLGALVRTSIILAHIIRYNPSNLFSSFACYHLMSIY